MPKTFLGIDPGSRGGLALLDEAGQILDLQPMPMEGGEVDVGRLAKWLVTHSAAGNHPEVWVEEVGPNPRWSRKSIWSFAQNAHAVHVTLKLLAWPYLTVLPQVWQKILGGKWAEGKRMKGKKPSLKWADEKWDLQLGDKDGLSDSLAICEWARQKWLKERDVS